MNIKSVVLFETQKNGRNYAFYVENGSPFAEALEASVEIVNQIDTLAKAAAEKEAAEQQSKEPISEVVEPQS